MDVSKMIDVHTFDRNWNKNLVIKKYSDTEHKLSIEWLLNLYKKYNKKISEGLYYLLNNNCNDNINNVTCFDILVEIKKKLNIKDVCDAKNDIPIENFMEEITKDFLDLLNEQMTDMYNLGRCEQGRSCRLFQLFMMLE